MFIKLNRIDRSTAPPRHFISCIENIKSVRVISEHSTNVTFIEKNESNL